MLPNQGALFGIQEAEIDDGATAAKKRYRVPASCWSSESPVRDTFHALRQVADFDIGVAIVAVLTNTRLPNNASASSKEQDRATGFGRIEYPRQIFFRFADIFAHDLAQVDLVQVEKPFASTPAASTSYPVPDGLAKQSAQTEGAP